MAKYKETVVKAEPKTVVYLGVSIPGTPLSYGNIYSNGYPDTIKSLMEAIPEIKPLMVEVTKTVEFKAELKIKGSYASTLYKKLEDKLGGN